MIPIVRQTSVQSRPSQALIRSIRIGIASRYTSHTSSSWAGLPVNQARALRISGVSG
jgi:hypothetical protein